MPVRTRNSSGRFEPLTPKIREQHGDGIDLSFIIPRRWLLNFSMLTVIFILISPWLFMMIKKNSFSSISQKVTEFYDDNFSCNSNTGASSILKTNNTKEKETNF